MTASSSDPDSAASPDDDPAHYPGLPADEAERRALAHGWTTVRMVAPGTMLTMEHLEGRLNFEVEDGRVRRAWSG
ncbi:I78 family peptidase inhibitor [Streptomyces kutzneri]|uniref:I78 family peptidase inhibitor n=1 Tax=Streptomyces kutzneri TaxID=3051179 RepID=UPI0028D2073B|nr:I78 family peptidase inhibitor [Streptomyces sp. DSM 40907]